MRPNTEAGSSVVEHYVRTERSENAHGPSYRPSCACDHQLQRGVCIGGIAQLNRIRNGGHGGYAHAGPGVGAQRRPRIPPVPPSFFHSPWLYSEPWSWRRQDTAAGTGVAPLGLPRPPPAPASSARVRHHQLRLQSSPGLWEVRVRGSARAYT